MAKQWENWSGSLQFSPEQLEKPESVGELQQLVGEVANRSGTIRVVGRGHSSTPLVATDDTLVSLENFGGVLSTDRERCEAWVRPGTMLKDMGEELLEADLAVHNLGDVNVQHLGGAVGTGTHGTGKNLGNLSTMVLGVKMITADGEVIERHIEDDPDFLRAARVSLGTLGIFVAIRIQLLPAYQLHRQEWCTGVEECMEHLDELIEENRNFDFYWYPRSDEVKLRTLNPPGESAQIPYADLLKEGQDWAPNIISKARHLPFDEMEYCLPAEAGPSAFRAVRERILKEHRRTVGWRTLYRTTASDDAMLSSSYNRPTVTLSLHQNAGLEFWDFFRDMEPIFQAHEGRPHWGKKHTLRAEELRKLYPEWETFQKIRRDLDPRGLWMTDYLRDLFEGRL